jgi:hypothetical protein
MENNTIPNLEQQCPNRGSGIGSTQIDHLFALAMCSITSNSFVDVDVRTKMSLATDAQSGRALGYKNAVLLSNLALY